MLKKGDAVVMHSCDEAEENNGRIWVCESDEYKKHPIHEFTMIMLEGYGAFETTYLQKVNFDFSYQQFLANEKNYEQLVYEHADLAHFKDAATKVLSEEQLEEIQEEMENIPETGIY